MDSPQSATQIIADWKRRLTAMAENPPYVFRDTPPELIEQHHRRQTVFVGYSEAEVASAEAHLGGQFPTVFRTYLLEMAQSPGDLFRGSHLAGIDGFASFRAEALALLAETDPSLTLPPLAVVFMIHQGYTFLYIEALGGFDGPVFQWEDGNRAACQVSPEFRLTVEGELELMDHNHRQFHEQGGYYLTLHPGGGESMDLPSLASGERPLGKRKWQFWK